MKAKVFIVALLFLSLVLGFCGAESVKGAKPQNIYFLNFFVRGSDSIAKGADPLITKYKKDFPLVTLNEESLGFSDALNKLKSLGAANDLPDLCMPNIPMAKEWAANGLLRPIDDLLDADPTWKKGFLSGSLDEFKFDGRIYGIPAWKNITGIVFYNKAVFQKCGIREFPKTWDQFLDAIAAIKKNGYIPWTTFGKKQWGFSSIASVLNYSQFGTDWFNKLARGEAKFTDDQFLQTLACLKRLQQLGAFNEDMYSLDQTQARSYYLDGKAAMSVDGTWAVGLIGSNASPELLKSTELSFIPSPTGRAGNVIVPAAGGWGLCISSKVADKDKAVAIGKLIKYISDANFGESLLYAGVYPSSMPKKYDAAKLSPLAVKYMKSLAKIDAGLFWDLVFSSAVIDRLEVELELFMLDKKSAKDMAQDMETFYEEQRE